MSTAIITTPGNYVARDGRRVVITEIRDQRDPFCCRGHVNTMSRRGERFMWAKWTPQGRADANSSPNPIDVVGVWPAGSAA